MGTACKTAVLAALAIFAAGCASREATSTFDEHGISFPYPQGWHVTGFSTTNSPSRLAVTSYPVPREAVEGDCGGYKAVKLLPADGALVILIDYGPGLRDAWGDGHFPPRPSVLRMGDGRFSDYECFGQSTMFRLRVGKRDLQAHVALGREAGSETREQALAVLSDLAVSDVAEQPLTLYTHCGVWSATVDGRLWLAEPPLHDGSHNPLPGWDSNDTPGTWRDLGDGRAEFRADSGKVAHFVAAQPGQDDPNAGCE